MRIVTWNVNGIRAVYKSGKLDWVFHAGYDVVCLQETKASPDQLPPELISPDGYQSYFAACTVKKGYSGVVTYTRRTPDDNTIGMGMEAFDDEGRMVTTYFGDTVVSNVYFPNGGRGEERVRYKLAWQKWSVCER